MSSSKSTKHHSFIQTISSLTIFVFLMVFLPSHSASNTRQYNIGVLMMDEDKSHTGKEAKVAMEIAAKNLNDKSMNHKLRLHFNYTGGNPMQAAFAAEQLIREEDVQALIVMGTWDDTASVAVVGSLAKVPIISFASKSASLPRPLKPSLQLQWPYLIQMGSDITKQINIAAAIIQTFKWQKVVAIYELDQYGGDSSGAFVALNDALEEKDIEIEYGLSLPPFSSLEFDPQTFIRRELEELTNKSSRVFVVLRSSMSMAAHLFTEANNMGLIGQDSVWIVLEDIASQLHSFNTSVISSMQGALGIKQYYSEESLEFLDFNHKFRKRLQSQYPDENNFDIGISALRAYDSVAAIARAIENSSAINSSVVLKEILAQHFLGQYHSGSLSLNSSVYSLVNVAPASPINLGFWTPGFGFSEKLPIFENASESMQVLASLVKYWPGGLGRVPKGWSMPRAGKIMKIGVPGRTTFEKFVKVELNKSSNTIIYTGFCIELFQEVVKILEERYPFPYEFEAYNGSYDDLVNHVANKSYDAVIGDVTILASRSKYVEFTQPYAESGLAMVVLNKPDHSWIFLKPFTREMWALTAAILIYTVVIVWLLERGESNPEFQGPWYDQLSVALWFTFSSLFFVQREQVRSNYTRVVVIVWFFVVLALTISYTAILTSLLTVVRLKPDVTDINWLRTSNATIGCDGDSFIRKYLVDVLEFESTNIRNISSEYNYPREFESGNIMAAFLELPYEKTFINQYCKSYTVPETTKYKGDRFGGLGFVFQKGSPIATDVSEAILDMSENGVLKQLHEKWFSPSPACRTSQKNVDYNTDSLDWQGFWGLYLFSAATSTISYLIFAAHQYYKRHQREAHNSNRMLDSLDYNIVAWNKFVTLISLFNRVREKIAPETSLAVEPEASDETKEQIQVSLTEIGISDSVLG